MKKLEEFLKNITPEEIEKMAKAMAQQFDKEQYNLEQWLKSDRFSRVMALVEQELTSTGVLSDNPYQEPLFGDVSNQEFIQLFAIAFSSKFNSNPIQETSDIFPGRRVEFMGLEFEEFYGQGTAFFLKKK